MTRGTQRKRQRIQVNSVLRPICRDSPGLSGYTHVSDLGFTRVERLLDACYSHPLLRDTWTYTHIDVCFVFMCLENIQHTNTHSQ